jgi:uncharacterized repeat protein (TIGR01451 family)
MAAKTFTQINRSINGLRPIVCLLVVVLSGNGVLRAQTAATYTFSAFNATYTALTGDALPTIQQNNHDTTISLGFNFNFAGGTYNTVTVSSNGQLSFNPFVVNDLGNSQLTADSIGPMLMPLWDDVSGDSATVTYNVTGTAPNRVFKVEYSGWRWSSSSATNAISMQVSMYETDNIIDFQYQQGPTPYDGLAGGATIGIHNNATDWQTLPDATTNPTPSSATFTTNIAQKPASGQVYRWSPPVAAAANSFTVVAYDNCTTPQFVANTATYTPGMGVKTYYGDTHSDSTAVTNGNFGGHTSFSHTYATSGTYSVKMILYNGATAVDSVQFSYTHTICNTMYIGFFYDDNGNCSQDAGEPDMLQPSLTEVDSNGIAIDTIPATSGFYYTAYGNAGDVYEFKPVSMAADLYVHCPGTGVISNTLTTANNIAPKYFAIECANGSYFDLAISATTISGRHTGNIDMLVSNSYCAPKNTDVTLTFNPGYAYNTSTPAAALHTSTTAVWNINGLSAITSPTPGISCHIEAPVWFTIGMPVDYMMTITPTTGDVDTTNNTVIIHDTITGAYDPNHIQVNPDGHIAAGTKLTYSIEFENTGNDTATNIYVMDTIPAELDFGSVQIKAASGVMNVVKYTAGGYHIIKFDFPNIMLSDSVHHPENCRGMFTYTINAKNGLPDGTLIHNRAGIYFDDNEVVMTNTTENIIGFPTGVKTVTQNSKIDLFPNPVTNQLTIKMLEGSYSLLTITNAMGQAMMQQRINSALTRVNTSSLPAGLYYISLTGANGTETRKLIKL